MALVSLFHERVPHFFFSPPFRFAVSFVGGRCVSWWVKNRSRFVPSFFFRSVVVVVLFFIFFFCFGRCRIVVVFDKTLLLRRDKCAIRTVVSLFHTQLRTWRGSELSGGGGGGGSEKIQIKWRGIFSCSISNYINYYLALSALMLIINTPHNREE